MAIPSEALKKCSKCGEAKELKDFYVRQARGKPYRQAQCKICIRREIKARKTGSDRERVLGLDRDSTRIRRQRIKDEVFAAYGGYVCCCCGETEKSFLTLDHIANDGGEFRKKELGRRTAAGYHTYQWLKRKGFPRTVQVMCMNCQHGKLMNNGRCPHQRTCNDYPAREYGQAAGSAPPLQ